MNSFSPVEKPLGNKEEIARKPAPYNWLAILAIVIVYMLFAMFR